MTVRQELEEDTTVVIGEMILNLWFPWWWFECYDLVFKKGEIIYAGIYMTQSR